MGLTPRSAAEYAAGQSSREWLNSPEGIDACFRDDWSSVVVPRINAIEAEAVEEVSGTGWSCQLAYSHARRAVRGNLEAEYANHWRTS